MKAHILKTDPQYFKAVERGEKRFEIRKNDRGFEVGDTLILTEHCRNPVYSEKNYHTGAVVCATVTYKTDFEQKEDMVVLGIEVQSTYRPTVDAASPR